MTVIDGMIFTAFFLPVVFVGREEGVGLGRGVVDLRQTETVGEGQGLTIDAGTADNINVLIRGAMLQSFFERGEDVDVFLWNVECGARALLACYRRGARMWKDVTFPRSEE